MKKAGKRRPKIKEAFPYIPNKKECFGKVRSPKGPKDCQVCVSVVACAKAVLSAPLVNIEEGKTIVVALKKDRAKWVH